MSRGPLICDGDPIAAAAIQAVLGGDGRIVIDLRDLRDHLTRVEDQDEDTVVLGPGVGEGEAFAIAGDLRLRRPSLGVVLVRSAVTTPLLQEALRSGVREVVDHRDVPGLRAAVDRSTRLAASLRVQAALPVPAGPGPGPGTVITVFAAKGGCGKTMLATNLAAALADRGRRQVVVVDLDLSFGDVAIALQLFPAHTIADAVPMGGALDPDALHALLTTHSPGLSALVAPVDPATAESVPASLVSRILDLLRRRFDYVIVDTPPAFNEHVLAAFDVTDVVALIATLDVPALKNLKLTLETLDLLNYPREKWRIVLNRADSKVGLGIGEVEKTLRTQISAHIPSSRDVPAAVNRGVPILLDDPKHPVSVAIRQFAERQIGARAGAIVPAPAVVQLRGGRGSRGDGGDRRGLIRKRRPRIR